MATRPTFILTQAEALAVAADVLAAVSAGDAPAVDPREAGLALNVVRHMLEQKSKPAKRSDAPSKNTLQNIAHARAVSRLIWDMADVTVTDEDGTVTVCPAQVNSKTLVGMYGAQEVNSTQKMSAILKHAIDSEWVARVEVKGKVMWQRGEVDPR